MRRPLLILVALATVTALAGCTSVLAPEASPVETVAAPETSAATNPASTPMPTATDLFAVPAADAVARMTVEQRAASVVMGHVPTTDPTALHDYMASGLGGFILMGANVPDSPEALRAVTASLVIDPAVPPLIGIDQEGGEVSRLAWDDNPAADTLKFAPAADTRQAFAARAGLVAASGANVNFGVVADVPRGESSFIYDRALGADTASAAARVPEAIAGEHGVVLSTVKHYPGHGAAPGDSHHGIPYTDESLEQWRAVDAPPFIAGIDAGAELMMVGHLEYASVDAAPASLSAEWHRIAREDLGFTGLMITDDLGMLLDSGLPEYADPGRNAVLALAAGNDMLLIAAGSTPETARDMVDAIVAAVADGTLPEQRLTDAAERVMRLRLGLAG